FARAFHLSVEVTVGVVVDAAARRTHQDGAQHEDDDVLDARRALARYPQAPQGGPQQQINADGTIHARQAPEVRGPSPGKGKAPLQALQKAVVVHYCRYPEKSCIIDRRTAALNKAARIADPLLNGALNKG